MDKEAFPGRNGISPTVKAVADELVTQKVSELGGAIIDAESSDRNKSLSTRITYWLKDLLKGDQDFKENVADELLGRTSGNSIVSEVAKKINKRSVEDRAVRKVTDKVDMQAVVENIDQASIAEKLVDELGNTKIQSIVQNKATSYQIAQHLVKILGTGRAETIVQNNTESSLLIDKLLEKIPGAEQKIIGILTDPNNAELIIKAFAEKYPEIDIRLLSKLEKSKKLV